MSTREIVTQSLLTATGISEQDITQVLGDMLGHHIDAADMYFQSSILESWALEDGMVKSGVFKTDSGVGVRAMAGEKTGFAYSDELMIPAITQAAKAAKSIARAGQNKQLGQLAKRDVPQLYQAMNPIDALSNDKKVAFLQAMDSYARSLDPRIIEVEVSMSGSYEVIFVVDTDGTMGHDVRPLVRLSVSVLAEQNGRRERGGAGGGGRYAYEDIIANDGAKGKQLVKQAIDQALINLEAIDAPAGPMPVVLGPGWPGVLLHEAVGHGLEGDFNRKGTSAFAGRIGEKVASELCTIVDDGTLMNRRGSLSIDDEGTPSQCTTLIENGRLVGYMQDKFNARLMGLSSTGNGRRQSFAHLPMTRMTNTYMQPGESAPEEIIKSVKKGLYAVNFGGGQVDITSGKFVFSANEAYLIEDGKITAPVKGATLIGNGPETMTKVSMVGNDLQLDEGVGVCGKQGQSVPVGVGQPTLLVDEIVVGGTSD